MQLLCCRLYRIQQTLCLPEERHFLSMGEIDEGEHFSLYEPFEIHGEVMNNGEERSQDLT